MANKKPYLTILFAFIFTCVTATHVTAQQTKVYINPENLTIPEAGLLFTINITIQNVNDLYAWALKLYYPNDILNAITAAEGPMLKTGGALTSGLLKHIFTDEYNETHGLISMFCTRIGDVSGVNGDGVLATITFHTKSNGNATLHLADVNLSDSNEIPNPIPCATSDGTVTVVPEFPITYILPTLILSALTIITLRKTLQKPKPKHKTANT